MPRKIPPLPKYDPSNISGAKLAEIGRWVLTGKQVMEEQEEGNYTDIGWLDMRIDEICERGKL